MVLALNHYLLRGGPLIRRETEYDGIEITGVTKEIPLTTEEKTAKLEKAVGREIIVAQDNKEFVGEGSTSGIYAVGVLRKENEEYFMEVHYPSGIRAENIDIEHLYFLAVLSKPC